MESPVFPVPASFLPLGGAQDVIGRTWWLHWGKDLNFLMFSGNPDDRLHWQHRSQEPAILCEEDHGVGPLDRVPSDGVGNAVMAAGEKAKVEFSMKGRPAVMSPQQKSNGRKEGTLASFEDKVGS